MYVQDMIKEEGKLVCDLLLRDGCTYYVSGDANMSDFCYEAIVDVLSENGDMSRAQATQMLKRMRVVENRWQYDIWGVSSYLDDDSYVKRKVARRKSNQALAWLSSMKKKQLRSLLGDEDSSSFARGCLTLTLTEIPWQKAGCGTYPQRYTRLTLTRTCLNGLR